ncbi:MAG: hypothetical protein JXN10_08520, partial [Clostridia bacterium]|nr:hypothetical protein [Clostridia bacterium]
ESEIFSLEVALAETSADMRKTLDEKLVQYKKAVLNRRIMKLTAELDMRDNLDNEKIDELQKELAKIFEELRILKRK